MELLWLTFYANLQARTISNLKTSFKKLYTEKNINILYTEMQGYYSKFKYWNFKKTLKINQSNPVSR